LPGVLGRVSDPMSGYFMIRRAAIAEAAMHPLGYKILVEVIGRGRVRWIAEVGYVSASEASARARSPGACTWTTCGTWFACAWSAPSTDTVHSVRAGRRFGRARRHGVPVPAQRPARARIRPDAFQGGGRRARHHQQLLWNDAWTFRDLVGDQRGLRHKLRRLLKFNAVCGIGLVLNVLLLNLQFNVFHINRYVANLVAIAVVTAWNYWLNLRLNWRDTARNG
jgi:dolichol-phosphate mannosyltransferase